MPDIWRKWWMWMWMWMWMGMWMRRAYSGYKLLGRLARLTKGMPKKAAVISGRGHLVPATCMRNAKMQNAKMQNAKCELRNVRRKNAGIRYW